MRLKRPLFFFVCLVMLGLTAIAQPVTITPESAQIEPGESVTLTASGAMYYIWSPSDWLSTTEGPVTVASPPVTTTYTCSCYAPGPESVTNGGFEQGNIGFTSSYQYNTNVWDEGTYCIDTDASLHHIDFVGMGHGGTGNFMMVNGSVTPGTNVWTQQITVNPNTYYAFSTWVCTLAGVSGQEALLQFSINGVQIGEIFSAPSATNQWLQFYELWNSGDNTSATITILNQNTVGSGNDFGLDDVSFCEIVVIGEPQCTVTVGTLSANSDYQQTCFGAQAEVPFLDNDQLLNVCDDFSCQIVQQAAHGIATYANGVMTYTPNAGFSGSDQFDYRITCGEQSAEATVFMTVASEIKETLTEAVCESLTWHGHTFTHSIDTTWAVSGASSQGCDSVFELHLTVYPANETTINEIAVCPSELPYVFYGQAYYSSIDTTVLDYDIHGCDSVVRLLLTVNNYYYADLEEAYICYESTPSYTWNPVGDILITYTEEGNYVDTLPTDNCEGIFSLDLHFMKMPAEEYIDTIVCESYTWPVTGETYTEPADYYHYVSLAPYPCQRVYHLHIEAVNHDPLPVIKCITPGTESPHYPITATEFNVNSYTYQASDSLSDFNWIDSICEWSISKESWRIVPSEDNRSCTVHPMDWTQDTVWLTFKAFNDCSSADGSKVSYWLKPSFYDIDELVGSEPAIEIVPNPNNGLMELHFGNMDGRVSVKVYDMKGNRIDAFETDVEAKGQKLSYHLQGRASGVYYFLIQGKEGVVTKKVVVVK